MHVTVHSNKLPIAPRKLRAVLGTLAKRSVMDATALLAASPRQTALPIQKLLKSSISAAHDRSPGLRAEQLLVEEIFCNESVRVYRTRRKSRGRTSRIAKRGSHLTLTVRIPDTGAQRSDAPKATASTQAPTSSTRPKTPKSEIPASPAGRRHPASGAKA